MQAAGDATALMLARSPSILSGNQLEQKAADFFLANFHRPEATNVQVAATYAQGTSGFGVTVNGSASVRTNFMSLVGFSQIPLTTTGSVNWNNSKLRVALVLDNTGSMSQYGKMTALKSAAKNLLTQLQQAAVNNGDIYVSIIPFAKDVNADPANYNQNWISWSGSSDTWNENNGTCSQGNRVKKSCGDETC
jgi:hypothetical protein